MACTTPQPPLHQAELMPVYRCTLGQLNQATEYTVQAVHVPSATSRTFPGTICACRLATNWRLRGAD